jgi:hypothetical protein
MSNRLLLIILLGFLWAGWGPLMSPKCGGLGPQLVCTNN